MDAFELDLHNAIVRRPVFPVDYFTGTPAITKEGRSDFISDLHHIKSYADPIVWRALQFCFPKYGFESGNNRLGSVELPDLFNITDSGLARWQKKTKHYLEPVLKQFRSERVGILVSMSLGMDSGGANVTGQWYHNAVPDWEECDYSGTPLSQVPKGGWGGNIPCTLPCLLHPKLYEMIDRVFNAISFLRDGSCVLGFSVDNELNLGDHRNLSRIGGNSHTRAAFRRFLKEKYPGISRLNRVAGTSYKSFDKVEISDDNWLIQTMAARFRSTWIEGVYLNRYAVAIKKHFPKAIILTRCQVGHTDREYRHGKEFSDSDKTYLKDSKIDLISWSHLWQSRPPRDPANDVPIYEGFGVFNSSCSLLRGAGKMLGITEPHVHRFGRYQYSSFRPEELLNIIYRGLYYNFRMLVLHSWDRDNNGLIYDDPSGPIHSKRQGLLRMVAQLRSELDRSRPYETFGKPILSEMAVVISRQSRNYPGMGGFLYGNQMWNFSYAMEDPRLGNYEIVEEQTNDIAAAAKRCKGLIIFDACLTKATRKLLSKFVDNGGKLLVFGVPATTLPDYSPAEISRAYPVQTPAASIDAAVIGKFPKSKTIKNISNHPVLKGLRSIKLQKPEPVRCKKGGKTLLRNRKNETVAAASSSVVYVSGVPTEKAHVKQLMLNFQRWCNIEEKQVLVSRFDNAAIVQNWDTSKHRRDGSLIDDKPWTGGITLRGKSRCAVREMRQDCKWLAYQRKNKQIIIEGVKLAQKDVKVFVREDIRELCHLEGVPDAMGFSYFWDGYLHPITGRFTVSKAIEVNARIVDGEEKIGKIEWFVCEVGGKKIASGKGRKVSFYVRPGREYYFAAIRVGKTHEQWKKVCPLCTEHAFE